MKPIAAVVAGALIAAGVGALPSEAATKKKPKPIKKTYTATAPLPDPTNYAQQGYSVCAQNVPGSFDQKEFKAPAAGSISVTVKDYTGDWDLLLEDADDVELTASGSSDLGAPEQTFTKLKKGQVIHIVACNWAGTSTATVSYTFTYK